MPRVADYEIIKRYSKFLLFSDNRTKKYLPVPCRRITKNNKKNMNHQTGKHTEQASMKNMLK